MPEATNIMVTANPVDEDFVKTTGLQLLTGTDFTQQDVRDISEATDFKDITHHFILNESAAKALGWSPEEAIGKKMFLDNHRPGFVKAVIRDFHFTSLHKAIKPLVLFTEPRGNVLLVKVSGNNLSQTIASLKTTWQTAVSHRPFDYHFLDDDYNRLYQSELRTGKVLNIFVAIAVLLAAAGLFGLSAYSAQQRTKEFGIRKVLGAGVFSLVALLTKDFAKMVILACLLAFPIAWYTMHKWLEDFTYRIDITWWVFALSGIVMLLIAVITVSLQAIKAAMINPVVSLKTE